MSIFCKILAIGAFSLILGLPAKAIELTEAESKIKDSQLELGLGIGTPAVVNFNFGFWDEAYSYVARASVGYWIYAGGTALELGWLFDSEGTFRQYIGVSGAVSFGYDGILFLSAMGMGPVYGLAWNGWTASLGFYMAGAESSFLGFQGSSNEILPLTQIGYSWFIQ